jgi:hypothetical protein
MQYLRCPISVIFMSGSISDTGNYFSSTRIYLSIMGTSMGLEELKTITEIIQNIVSILAIIAAGIWSYFVFVLGRSHAVKMKLELIPQYKFKKGENLFIVLRITAENVGKTKARNRGCYVALEELSFEHALDSTSWRYPLRVDSSIHLNRAKTYDILCDQTFLEPNEGVSEDAIFLVNPNRPIKVGVYWFDVKFTWKCIYVIEPSLVEGKTK